MMKTRKKSDGKLTEQQVRTIKQRLKLYDWGMIAKLAKEFGVSNTMICRIRDGGAWPHVRP